MSGELGRKVEMRVRHRERSEGRVEEDVSHDRGCEGGQQSVLCETSLLSIDKEYNSKGSVT